MLSEIQEIHLINQKYLERFRLTTVIKDAIINTIEAARTRNQVVLISPVGLTSVNSGITSVVPTIKINYSETSPSISPLVLGFFLTKFNWINKVVYTQNKLNRSGLSGDNSLCRKTWTDKTLYQRKNIC